MAPLWVVTGFIAAGKSTLAAQLGRPIFSADAAVAQIYEREGIDRNERRRFFCADPAHPAQMARALAPEVLQMLAAFRAQHPDGIAEWPRTALPPPGDVLIVVHAPQAVRMERVRARGVDEVLLQAFFAAETHAAPLAPSLRRTLHVRNGCDADALRKGLHATFSG